MYYSVWGDSGGVSGGDAAGGFGEADDGFDSFLSMTAPPPELDQRRRGSGDSDRAPDFSVYIKYVSNMNIYIQDISNDFNLNF